MNGMPFVTSRPMAYPSAVKSVVPLGRRLDSGDMRRLTVGVEVQAEARIAPGDPGIDGEEAVAVRAGAEHRVGEDRHAALDRGDVHVPCRPMPGPVGCAGEGNPRRPSPGAPARPASAAARETRARQSAASCPCRHWRCWSRPARPCARRPRPAPPSARHRRDTSPCRHECGHSRCRPDRARRTPGRAGPAPPSRAAGRRLPGRRASPCRGRSAPCVSSRSVGRRSAGGAPPRC